ncbi:hypothetical protein HHL14_10195 [Paraburkholderia sp. G-4-1-8]|uniref:Uncharacterized protein n=1 Tax=Paraburkholderia antibiotica TaxID=2728839 RepID=A0A7X9X4R9_9BURK|nr:hypothetical protein [Paraburkholderia antibiotica]
MPRITVFILCAACVGGCANPAREAAFRHEEVAIYEARQQAAVHCEPGVDCEAAWALARAFIKAHSVTRIVRADDMAIETALPHSFGFVYLAASKGQADDGRTLIRLKAMCRGMYDTAGEAGLLYSTCAHSIVAIEAEFHAWMAARP